VRVGGGTGQAEATGVDPVDHQGGVDRVLLRSRTEKEAARHFVVQPRDICRQRRARAQAGDASEFGLDRLAAERVDGRGVHARWLTS